MNIHVYIIYIYIYIHICHQVGRQGKLVVFFLKKMSSPQKKMFGLDAKTETPEPTFKRIDTGVSENWF